MPKSLRTARACLGVAAFILVATGALHATGFSTLAETIQSSNIPSEWAPVLQGLWLMFSIHLVILAAVLMALAVLPNRLTLAAAALMPAADCVLLLVTVGVFIGTLMVGLASVLLLLGLAVLPGRLEPLPGKDQAFLNR